MAEGQSPLDGPILLAYSVGKQIASAGGEGQSGSNADIGKTIQNVWNWIEALGEPNPELVRIYRAIEASHLEETSRLRWEMEDLAGNVRESLSASARTWSRFAGRMTKWQLDSQKSRFRREAENAVRERARKGRYRVNGRIVTRLSSKAFSRAVARQMAKTAAARVARSVGRGGISRGLGRRGSILVGRGGRGGR